MKMLNIHQSFNQKENVSPVIVTIFIKILEMETNKPENRNFESFKYSCWKETRKSPSLIAMIMAYDDDGNGTLPI